MSPQVPTVEPRWEQLYASAQRQSERLQHRRLLQATGSPIGLCDAVRCLQSFRFGFSFFHMHAGDGGRTLDEDAFVA